MNKFSTTRALTVDCRICVASIAGVYAPLLLILIAALTVF